MSAINFYFTNERLQFYKYIEEDQQYQNQKFEKQLDDAFNLCRNEIMEVERTFTLRIPLVQEQYSNDFELVPDDYWSIIKAETNDFLSDEEGTLQINDGFRAYEKSIVYAVKFDFLNEDELINDENEQPRLCLKNALNTFQLFCQSLIQKIYDKVIDYVATKESSLWKAAYNESLDAFRFLEEELETERRKVQNILNHEIPESDDENKDDMNFGALAMVRKLSRKHCL